MTEKSDDPPKSDKEFGTGMKPVRKRAFKTRIKPVKTDAKDVHKCRMENGEIVWLHNGVSLDQLPHKIWPYSERMSDAIVQMVMEGATLVQISKIPGMPPYYTICRWLSDQKVDFQKRYREAKKIRAEIMADAALETARNSKDYRISEDRLKVETLKWAASVDNPDEYGNKTKISGDPDRPVAFLISTGVPRASDDGNPLEISLEDPESLAKAPEEKKE